MCREQACIADGMALAEKSTEPFVWLTCTNKGTSEICEPALELAGVSRDELQSVFFVIPRPSLRYASLQSLESIFGWAAI
jgi:hypothetical protein